MSELSEGLWLVNATGDMIPLHTAGDDDDDQELLEEYLEEWNLK